MFRFIGPEHFGHPALFQPAASAAPNSAGEDVCVVDCVDEPEVAEPGPAAVRIQMIDLRADAADGLAVLVCDEGLHVGVAKERMLRIDLVAPIEQQRRYPVRVVRIDVERYANEDFTFLFRADRHNFGGQSFVLPLKMHGYNGDRISKSR